MTLPIEELSRLYGISPSYHDWRGELREVSFESRAAILGALGIKATDERAAESAISQHETIRWTRLLPPVAVVEVDQPIAVPVAVARDLPAKTLAWTVTLESGNVLEGNADLARLAVLERGDADGREHARLALELPALPLGYHALDATLDSGLNAQARIIVAPAKCYEPPLVARGERVWGVAVQLYSLRSSHNWGIGDFGDLRELIRLAAPTGCQLIGLNPLHALSPADPNQISPYSPSSRFFLNVLYISVPDVEEYSTCERARALVARADFQKRLSELRATTNVDYVEVASTKFEILGLLYEEFRASHLDQGTIRAAKFRAFVETQGDSLRLHATDHPRR